MKKLINEIQGIADLINSAQAASELVHKLECLVRDYNLLYKDFGGTCSSCVLDTLAFYGGKGKVEVSFYNKCWQTGTWILPQNTQLCVSQDKFKYFKRGIEN